mmetsp:Transcript_67922/g.210007  ORF Transcript_67922/g.210007 Transcript_67922/m.210007 type:complete len:343 (+) Transcript_67922:1225-2253(+)
MLLQQPGVRVPGHGVDGSAYAAAVQDALLHVGLHCQVLEPHEAGLLQGSVLPRIAHRAHDLLHLVRLSLAWQGYAWSSLPVVEHCAGPGAEHPVAVGTAHGGGAPRTLRVEARKLCLLAPLPVPGVPGADLLHRGSKCLPNLRRSSCLVEARSEANHNRNEPPDTEGGHATNGHRLARAHAVEAVPHLSNAVLPGCVVHRDDDAHGQPPENNQRLLDTRRVPVCEPGVPGRMELSALQNGHAGGLVPDPQCGTGERADVQRVVHDSGRHLEENLERSQGMQADGLRPPRARAAVDDAGGLEGAHRALQLCGRRLGRPRGLEEGLALWVGPVPGLRSIFRPLR